MTLRQTMTELRRAVVLQALYDHGGSLTQTAKHLGVHRKHMNRLCQECGIDLKQLRLNWKSATLMSEIKSKEIQ
jgi:DNA-binding NtrC family response regulator